MQRSTQQAAKTLETAAALIKAEGEDTIDLTTPEGVLRAVQDADDGYLTPGEEALLEAALKRYPALTVQFMDYVVPNTYVVGDQIVEGHDGYFKAQEPKNWLQGSDADDVIDVIAEKLEERINENFQSSPCMLYHATDSQNIESIMRDGLEAKNRTRGLTNRSVGLAIFTVDDRNAVSDSYGDTVLAIDLPAMKRDGVKFEVAQEPSVLRSEAAGVLANILGVEDGSYEPEHDGADDPATIILYCAVVEPKYLKIVQD